MATSVDPTATAADPLLAVACPYCGELPGAECIRLTTEPIGGPTNLPHPQRLLVLAKWSPREQ